MHDDKIILVHNGALGDFLIAWPALLAVARQYGNEAALLYAGREPYTPWAAAAGFQPAPGEIRAAVERLYGASSWDNPALAPLAGSRIIWIGLRTPPFDAALLHATDGGARLTFLPMVPEDGESESVRAHLARMLDERLALPWPEDAATVWQERVARWHGLNGRSGDEKNGEIGGSVLLFPGAGHRAKEWPAQRWLDLARRLLDRGLSCRLVLGPVELERGFDAQSIPAIAPPSLAELIERIAEAAAVAGADTGPMHAAALTGTPALALFGPTGARLWAPAEACILRADVDCRPCSTTTHGIACAERDCMESIAVDAVEKSVLEILDVKKEKPACLSSQTSRLLQKQ